jgi:hypothetical protein
MSTTLYVKSPVRHSVQEIIQGDVERKYLAAKLRTPEFYAGKIRWSDSTRSQVLTADNIDGFMYEWETKSRDIITKYAVVPLIRLLPSCHTARTQAHRCCLLVG